MGEVNKEQDIIDIDLSVTRRKKFRIIVDENQEPRYLYLNTSDAGIVGRLNEVYPKLKELAEKACADLDVDGESEEQELQAIAGVLKEIDTQMRDSMDYLFDSNVSETCVPTGTMWDPFDGQFRFEHIIESLSPVYKHSFAEEFAKMSKRMKTHTSKYKKKR